MAGVEEAETALQFLVKYAWVFLTLVSLVAGIAAIDPLSHVPRAEQCTATSNLLTCQSYTLANDSAELLVSNNAREAVTVANITVTTVNNGNPVSTCTPTKATLRSGTTNTITCDNLPLQDDAYNSITLKHDIYESRVGPSLGHTRELRVTGTTNKY